jgi:UDP-N-acetylmuramoyl-tripeptide--D-alanyl-D-alanine ligase
MGSLLGVADTKAAIYDALPNGGTAVINADDAFAPYFAERAHGRRLVRFGIDSTADVVARDIRPDGEGTRFNMETPQGATDVTLALPGRHNVRNALAAAAMAMAVGATLEQVREGLAAATPVAGRLVARTLPGGATIVDDSYNANPGSLLAAIELLGSGPQAGWLVLGDMRELGEDAAALHAEAGRRARAAGIARLYALGELSAHAARGFGEDGRVFSDHAALADALRADLARHPDVRVLVKGSRGSRMDRIVTALLADGSPTDGRPAEKRGESHDAA